MLALIFPTFYLPYLADSAFLQSRQDKAYVADVLDFEECCKNRDCYTLGDGQCDDEFNTEVCGWDKGDCGYCGKGCYFEMLNNGKCEKECENFQCFFDHGDCRRELVDMNIDDECDVITINNENFNISKSVMTKLANFTFENIKSIQGNIEYNTSNEGTILKSVDLDIAGNIKIGEFFVEHPENISLRIKSAGIVEFTKLCFDNVNVLIEPNSNISLKINKFSTSIIRHICISFEIELVKSTDSTESQEFVLKFNSSNKNPSGITIDSSQNPDLQKNLSMSNINIDNNFVFKSTFKNTLVNISNSNFIAYEVQMFKVTDDSRLQIYNSNLEMDKSLLDAQTKGLFFYVDSSKVIVIHSDLNDCNDKTVAELDKNSFLSMQDVNFTNCKFQNMTGITEMTNCNNQTCESEMSSLNSCPDGYMDINGCKKCPNGYYRFNKLGEIFCFKCPVSMDCADGIVKPNKEYYRYEDEIYQVFRKCLNPKACIGSEPNENNKANSNITDVTKCGEGYTGRFCSTCQTNYTSNGRYQCGKCPEKYQNVLLILLAILVVSVFIVYMIKTTVLASFVPSEFYSIAMKIGINYFQVIYLCLQFRISWPSTDGEKNNGNDGSDQIEGKSNYYISFQCLFESTYVDYYYQRVIFMAMMPIIICIFSVFYLFSLSLYKKLRKKKLDLTIYKPVTFIIPFLLIYPYVITYTLSPIACDSLESTQPKEFDEKVEYSKFKYLMEVPDIYCTWDNHYKKIIWVTGFSIIVWGFGVPIYIFYKLYQKRKNLFNYEVKYTFGFLISGYLHERFYWEFIIFIKKLMIVFLTVFMQTGYSVTLQSILLITFLIGGFILQIYYKPYITDELNNLDTSGTLAAIITVLAAIIYTESSKGNTNLKFFLVVILIVVNCLYILYWISFMSKEFIRYIIVNVEFLKKHLLNRDGFNRDYSKEFIDPDHVYVKEYQKLFTQAKFDDPNTGNYLGDKSNYNGLLTSLIRTNLDDYLNNRGPDIRSIARMKTIKDTRYGK